MIMISVNNVSKNYKDRNALRNVEFSMSVGEIVGLVGPNGAGKSTLLRLISGINNLTSGEIVVQMCNCKNLQMSTIFDFNGLYQQLTAYENLLFFLKLKEKYLVDERGRIENILEKMQLLDWRDKKVKNFSKGMLRKLTIARAIITNPDILILDEPFDGLDIESHKFVIDFLKKWVSEKPRSILLTSHNMLDVENICSRVIMISNGKIVKDEKIKDMIAANYKYLIIRFAQKYNIEQLKYTLEELDIQIEKDLEEKEFHFYTKVEKVPQIINILSLAGFEIYEVIKEKTSIEEVYLHIIGGCSHENVTMERY